MHAFTRTADPRTAHGQPTRNAALPTGAQPLHLDPDRHGCRPRCGPESASVAFLSVFVFRQGSKAQAARPAGAHQDGDDQRGG
eukprot:3283995-Rhodomonas_salina.1